MDRRDVLLAGLAVPGSGIINRPSNEIIPIAERPRLPIHILAPKDCFVIKVIGQNGPVSADASLLELDSDDENAALARVETSIKLLNMQKDSLSDDKISARKAVLQSAIDVAQAYVDFATTRGQDFIAPGAPSSYQDNMSLASARSQAFAAAARATSELQRAKTTLELYDFTTQQALAKLALLEDELNARARGLNSNKARLTIKSPASGTLSLKCYEGGFVTRGQVLAEIA